MTAACTPAVRRYPGGGIAGLAAAIAAARAGVTADQIDADDTTTFLQAESPRPGAAIAGCTSGTR
jgi:thioredoxin reductase